MSDFTKYVCWTREGVADAGFDVMGSKKTVDDALVQATRVEVPITGLGLSETYRIENIVEEFVGTFEDKAGNSIFAILGDSGSGKTFLVRCILSLLEGRDDSVVVYIPREKSSMKQILKLLLEQLPGRAASEALRELDLASSDDLPIESAMEVVYTQLRVIFQSGSISVGREFTPDEQTSVQYILGSRESEDGIFRNGLADYLDIPVVKSHFLQEGGVLWKHVQALRGIHTDEELPRFAVEDMPILTYQQRSSFRNMKPFFEWTLLPDQMSTVAKLIDGSLDQALSTHIRMGRELGEIVDESRQILAKEGKQLVLLFEDIARHGGVSHSIYNLFRDLPEENKTPIRAFFAATTGFFNDKIQNQVSSVTTAYEVVTLNASNPDHSAIGRMMIARYFNVARLGESRILEMWNTADDDSRTDGTWIPNACDDCSHKKTCHGEFGEIGGFGLYPLNVNAANRALRVVNINSRKMNRTEFHPRDIVRSVVKEWLRDSGVAIQGSRFPTRDIELIAHTAVNQVDQNSILTDSELSLPEDVRDRIHRTRVVWANSTSATRTYSAVLARAFDLPEFGDSVIDGADIPSEIEPKEPLVKQDDVVDFTSLFGSIAAWSRPGSDTKIEQNQVDSIRKILLSLTRQRLQLDRNFIHISSEHVKSLRDTILGENTFRIEQSYGDADDNRRVQRLLNRSETSARIIFAALWWSRAKTWDAEYREENKIIRANEREIREGRRLLIDYVTEVAQEVEQKIVTEIKRSISLAVKAKVRALELVNPDVSNLDIRNVIKLLTSTSFRELGESWRHSGFDLIDQIDTFENYVEAGISARQGERGKIRFAEDLEIKVNVLECLRQDYGTLAQSEEMDSRLNVKIQTDFRTWNQAIDERLEIDASAVADFLDSFSDVDINELQELVIQVAAIFEGLLHKGKIPQRVPPNAYRDVLKSLDGKFEKISQILKLVDTQGSTSNQSTIWNVCRSFPEIKEFASSLSRITEIAVELNTHLQSLVGNGNSVDIADIRNRVGIAISQVESILELVNSND
jgi:Cdc6-like AAA superfamily ATPase